MLVSRTLESFVEFDGIRLCTDAFGDPLDPTVLLIMGASLVGLATGNLMAILQACAPPSDVGIWTGIENFTGNVAEAESVTSQRS